MQDGDEITKDLRQLIRLVSNEAHEDSVIARPWRIIAKAGANHRLK
jgi:hypothetical protein